MTSRPHFRLLELTRGNKIRAVKMCDSTLTLKNPTCLQSFSCGSFSFYHFSVCLHFLLILFHFLARGIRKYINIDELMLLFACQLVFLIFSQKIPTWAVWGFAENINSIQLFPRAGAIQIGTHQNTHTFTPVHPPKIKVTKLYRKVL